MEHQIIINKGAIVKLLKNNIKNWVAAFIALIITVILVNPIYAYGPERDKTFTMDEPADYVVFNSITDNPVLGDERNFVRIAEADSGSAYGDDIKIEPGKIYELYIGYHNNAKDSLNASGVGIARGVKLAVQYPTNITPANPGTISAIISATNANPQEVWDEVHLTSDTDVTLNYVVGSAKIYNSWGTNGKTLSTDIFSTGGTYLGLNELDGVLPGCAKYSGHVLIKFEANGASSEVIKTVSSDGTNFSKEINVNPGDEVTYKIEFKNTGTKDLTNVTFHDELPANLSLVDGTTYLKYSTEDSATLITDLIASNGYNTGKYGPGTGATITYKVKVSDDQTFCGKATNKIFVDHDNGEVTDSAIITVNGNNCEETPPELPNTGPLEIVMAAAVIAGLGGGGYYLYRTRRTLASAETAAMGKSTPTAPTDTIAQSEPTTPSEPIAPASPAANQPTQQSTPQTNPNSNQSSTFDEIIGNK